MLLFQKFRTHSNKKDVQKGLQAHLEGDYIEDSLDPVYSAKAKVLNDALQEIGMGKYQVCLTCLYLLLLQLICILQWRLFFVAGFGFFS